MTNYESRLQLDTAEQIIKLEIQNPVRRHAMVLPRLEIHELHLALYRRAASKRSRDCFGKKGVRERCSFKDLHSEVTLRLSDKCMEAMKLWV